MSGSDFDPTRPRRAAEPGAGAEPQPTNPFQRPDDQTRRIDPEQLRDPRHRRPLRLVFTPDLADHPDRPLPQLGRVPLRCTP